MDIASINSSSNSTLSLTSTPLKVNSQPSRSVPDFQAAKTSSFMEAAISTQQLSQTTESRTDSVRVTSSIGRAASAGQLSKEEAVAIYQKIATLL